MVEKENRLWLFCMIYLFIHAFALAHVYSSIISIYYIPFSIYKFTSEKNPEWAYMVILFQMHDNVLSY